MLQFYIANGFYIVLDYHAGSGHIETDRQIVADEHVFKRNWLALMISIQSLAPYQEHIKGESTAASKLGCKDADCLDANPSFSSSSAPLYKTPAVKLLGKQPCVRQD